MLLIKNKKFGIVLAFAALVASCSMSTSLDASIEREVEASTKMKEMAKAPTPIENTDLVKVKNDIWLGDTSEIEYEGQPVPAYLETADGVTLISNRPITLFEIGDMLNKVTSLRVRFDSNLEKDIREKGSKNKPSAAAINADWTDADKMLVSYRGPLSGLLDEISSRFGIWWKYDKKEIHFYKYITKTFVLYSLPTKPKLNVTVGGSSSAGEGGSSSLSLSSEAEIAVWTQIKDSITSMISKDSKLTIDQGNGTITLTATPTDIKKVGRYITEQNNRLSRQVAISVKVLQVTVSDGDQYGLSLSAMFNDGHTSFRLASPTGSVADDIADNLAMAITPKNWSGSAIVKALSSQGATTLVTSGTVTTLNNKPAPIQVIKKQNYISEITKTNGGDNDYDISTETEEIETGFTLDVLPRILEHGRLLLMFNLTLSDLIELEKVYLNEPTAGTPSSASGQYIQNPKIESRGFTQEVAMSSGESLILTGYERVENTTSKEGIGSATNSLFGGSATASKERSVLVIILTPVVLESPLMPESRMVLN
ncbi:MAG: hypothetical protein SO314_04165 [Alphaproteobacteria bacterium]|nr:hypothetical protein [Alphaproteobacteria bacterium]